MKAFLAVMAVALIAVFVVNRPEEGDASGGQGTRSDSAGSAGAKCTVFADVPTLERDGRVTATGRYRCAKTDGGVDTTVYLQLNDASGAWANVDRQPMAATGADATRKRPERERTVRASAPCTAGSYRTFVRGTVSNGDRGYEVEAISKPTKIPCPTPS
jgi:hypothetical protein